MLELDLQTNLQAVNPFDPNEFEPKVRFKSPSGREMDIGAIWYQGYDLRTRQPSGNPGWKIRFTPDETGDWIAFAYPLPQNLQSAPFSFHVTPSSKPGFIRIDYINPRYLAFDNGDNFFPIGINLGWCEGDCDPVNQ